MSGKRFLRASQIIFHMHGLYTIIHLICLFIYLSKSVISTNPVSTDTEANIYVIDLVNSISHGTILQTRSNIVSSQCLIPLEMC